MTLILLIILILLLFGGGFGLRGSSSYGAYSGAGIGLGGLLLTGTPQFEPQATPQGCRTSTPAADTP